MSLRSLTVIGCLFFALVTTSILPARTADARNGKKRYDIVDTVLYINKRTGEFDQLIKALSRADLVEALRGGPFTVFAPTDDAFEDLLEALNLESVDQIPLDTLKTVLLYHVTEGRISYKAWSKQRELVMLNELPTHLSRRGYWRLYINDAKIIYWVIPTSNGNIYVIDKVLLPKAEPSES
jgi:transforming growth factor-beta-induced protein